MSLSPHVTLSQTCSLITSIEASVCCGMPCHVHGGGVHWAIVLVPSSCVLRVHGWVNRVCCRICTIRIAEMGTNAQSISRNFFQKVLHSVKKQFSYHIDFETIYFDCSFRSSKTATYTYTHIVIIIKALNSSFSEFSDLHLGAKVFSPLEFLVLKPKISHLCFWSL